jgi:hypothetical protein
MTVELTLNSIPDHGDLVALIAARFGDLMTASGSAEARTYPLAKTSRAVPRSRADGVMIVLAWM